jgi:hypothetical protein
VTWTSRTLNAPWDGRGEHTTVIDAAGAIYVIGGVGDPFYNDVWASTDGGAGVGGGGYWVGTQGILGGTMRYSRGATGLLKSTDRVLLGHYRR